LNELEIPLPATEDRKEFQKQVFDRLISCGSPFQMIMKRPSHAPEVFEVYRKYQTTVHGDAPGVISRKGFKNFLCDTPFPSSEDTTFCLTLCQNLPVNFGTYHIEYRLHAKLIGISVVDLLPKCISSVYFF